jgi:hypothetical protein
VICSNILSFDKQFPILWLLLGHEMVLVRVVLESLELDMLGNFGRDERGQKGMVKRVRL